MWGQPIGFTKGPPRMEISISGRRWGNWKVQCNRSSKLKYRKTEEVRLIPWYPSLSLTHSMFLFLISCQFLGVCLFSVFWLVLKAIDGKYQNEEVSPSSKLDSYNFFLQNCSLCDSNCSSLFLIRNRRDPKVRNFPM